MCLCSLLRRAASSSIRERLRGPYNATGLNIVVTATNTSGLSTSETFAVQTPAPAPPSVTNPTATQCCTGGQVDFTLAADTFSDPSGGTLAYAATLSNGAPLPSWLSFDPTTETFRGIMPDGTKALAINVTATNRNSLGASETFVLSIEQAAGQFGQAIAGRPYMDEAPSAFRRHRLFANFRHLDCAVSTR